MYDVSKTRSGSPHLCQSTFIVSLTLQMEIDCDESIDMMRDMTIDEPSFGWAVDRAIRSSSPSILGSSRLPSFASVIDSAIRSRAASNLGTFPVHSFAAEVYMRTVATRLSQAVSIAKRYVHGFQLFTMSELVAATNNFSTVNKIGAGSFGVVYRGYLADGREVAIKRRETGSNEDEYESELALSRLHHKHLIALFGFYQKKHERILVYEYMENGSLYDHLHGKRSSELNSWKTRIKIALDASRGIEYLHNYAVPSIIHRDIKSSNILLDDTWTARVSDFGLSVMSPEPDGEYEVKLAGTMGYLDPEYLLRGVVTAKSDVYGFGVILLELLTGKRAYKCGDTLFKLKNYAVPVILGGELVNILDPRVGPPDVNEVEALELVANTAIHCVKLKGEDRPTMTQIVLNLEQALAICDSSSYDNISSCTVSDLSESYIN